MKYLIFEVGGRPVANDDLLTLQTEAHDAIEAILQGAPPMVLSGCTCEFLSNSRGNISPGFVWAGYHIQRFDGASDVQFPCEIAHTHDEQFDPRPYQTGGTKNCMSEPQLEVQAYGTAATADAVLFGVNGPELTYWKWIESKTRYKGEVQWLTNHNSDLYDGTGRGWRDQAARGWQLCNGQGGAADLRERFIVGMNPTNGDYTIGKTGGEAKHRLTTDEIPAHKHGMQKAGSHAHDINSRGSDGGQLSASRGNQAGNDGNLKTQTAGDHVHEVDETGGGQEHENRPPYYTLVAREWVGF
ncbi:phage baseplate protein [Hymenobacter cavernae]|uniref:Phage tail collar domain-containing protein n=1 Tax=Hymenobacter cavernae TaxID=2044852 RepID=A0ABQ1UQ65_9BACT|nr:hypothetical protein [Hymenobacter cavernae]GGF22162.1 hypothetical protein GCM10011383_37220 [Hymenobacter cavernae]